MERNSNRSQTDKNKQISDELKFICDFCEKRFKTAKGFIPVGPADFCPKCYKETEKSEEIDNSYSFTYILFLCLLPGLAVIAFLIVMFLPLVGMS